MCQFSDKYTEQLSFIISAWLLQSNVTKNISKIFVTKHKFTKSTWQLKLSSKLRKFCTALLYNSVILLLIQHWISGAKYSANSHSSCLLWVVNAFCYCFTQNQKSVTIFTNTKKTGQKVQHKHEAIKWENYLRAKSLSYARLWSTPVPNLS